MAQLAVAHTRGWAANNVKARFRLEAENERLKAEVGLMREEFRIKARLRQDPASCRPHYPPVQRRYQNGVDINASSLSRVGT